MLTIMLEKNLGVGGAVRSLSGRIDLPTLAADAPPPGDPIVERLRLLLSNMSDDLNFDGREENLELIKVQTSALGRYVRFRQVIDGVPVFGSEVAAQVDDDKLVRISIARHMDRQTTEKVLFDGDAITKATAIKIAKNDVGKHQEITSHVEKTFFPTDDGVHLSFLIDIVTEDADWRYVVGAYGGEIHFKDDRRVEVNGTGMVYDPNPVVTANDNTFKEGVASEATLNAELVSRILQDITKSGTKYMLKGPYVQIINKQPENIDPPEPTTPTFNYDRSDYEFEAANVYYHIDQIQRYIQNTLGINNVLNWSIGADHHTALSGGAFYSPGGKFLGFGGSGSTRPDRGEDGDVMAHEYGHAIQHDIVSGWGGFNTATQRSEALAMGEGFGDALACIFFYEAGGIYQPEVFEDWIFAPNGLRRVDGVKQYPGEGTMGTIGDWVGQVHADEIDLDVVQRNEQHDMIGGVGIRLRIVASKPG